MVWNFEQYKGQYTEDTHVNHISAFCLLIKRDVFDSVGGWDEDFGLGNFEDTYLNYCLKKKGYELWISSDADVTHATPRRTWIKNKVDYDSLFKKNELIFKNKTLLVDGRYGQ